MTFSLPIGFLQERSIDHFQPIIFGDELQRPAVLLHSLFCGNRALLSSPSKIARTSWLEAYRTGNLGSIYLKPEDALVDRQKYLFWI